MPLPLISATPPSALKRSISASAPSAPGLDHDQAVGADAPVAVAQRGSPAQRLQPSARARRRATTTRGSRCRWRAASRGGRRSCAPACQEGGQHRARILRGPEPRDAGVTPEPHALAAGELPGAPHHGLERGVERRLLARQVAEDLPVPDRLRARCGRARRGPGSAGDLVDQTGVAHGRDPRARSASASTARGSQMPAMRTGNTVAPYSWSPAPNDENGRPVISITSRARAMRRALPGSIARRGRRVEPGELGVGVASPSGRRRAAIGVAHRAVLGRERRGRRRPPARRARCRRRAARADRAPRCRRPRRAPPAWNRATDHSSSGSATSTRWCGTAARSATVGLAVPMSSPR